MVRGGGGDDDKGEGCDSRDSMLTATVWEW